MKEVTAPMGGKVIEVKVKVGEKVEEEQEMAIIEAMKMEMPILTYHAGTVKEVKIAAGQSVEADQVILLIE
jgi:biotin carboxyl carrier protein